MSHRPRTTVHTSTTPATAARRGAAATAALTLALTLAACGTAPAEPATDAAASSSASSSGAATAVVLEDGWVKAVDAGAMGAMTAMFGTVRNTTDQEVTITGGSSPVAGMVEIHETVRNDSGAMQMMPKAGGVVIAAGGSHVLEPGGDHVMLMELSGPLETGTTTTVTLTTSVGDVALTVPVRTFAGAEESYVPSPTHS